MTPGTLELYVLGALSKEESRYIRERALVDPKLAHDIAGLETELERLAWQGRMEPPPHVRERVLTAINVPSGKNIPSLLKGATAEDLAPWLSTLGAPVEAFENMHVTPFSDADEVPSALVWVKSHVEEEVHTDVLESFLILEGTCEVLMQERAISMGPGDVMHIPLHTPHSVRVTSTQPCKAVVQRVTVEA